MELQSLGLNRDIEVTMENVPSSISLSGISHESGVLTISGIAPGEKTVLTYYSNLVNTGRFTDIETDLDNREDGAMEFTLRGSLLAYTDWVSSMDVILGNLPSSITLNTAATTEGALTLTGNSPDEDRLLTYLEKLDESGKFNEIVINEIIRIEDGSMNFELILKIEVIGE